MEQLCRLHIPRGDLDVHFLSVAIRITIYDKHKMYDTISSLEACSRFEKLQVPIY